MRQLTPVRLFVWAALAVTAVLIVVLALQARARQEKKQRTHATAEINDFDRWMSMTPRFLRYHANYVDDSFPTPPVTLMIFAPFTTVSKPTAQLLWALCKFAFITGIFAACWSMVRRAGVALDVPALLLIVAVWIWPVIIDVQEGQTNLLMLLPLAAGLALAQLEDGWFGPVAGGLLVALAICIKVTPLIFLVYALYRRRWRWAAAMVAGIALWLLAVPALAFGWRQNWLWLTQWTRIMILPYVTHGHIKYFTGQSVPSFVGRLLRHRPAYHRWVHGHRVPVYVNIARLPGPVVDWLTRLLLGGVALGGAWWMRRRLPALASRRYVLEVGCIAAFMLWASERTWVPHYVTLGITLFAAAMVLCDPQEPQASHWRAFLAMAVSAVLMLFTSDAARVFGPDGQKIMQTIGVSLWSGVLLVLAILLSRAAHAAAPAPLPGPPVTVQ